MASATATTSASANRGRPTRRPRFTRHALQKHLVAFVLVLPLLLVFGLFSWWPIVNGVLMSFQQINLGVESEWVGLDNFAYVLTDPSTWISLRNTVYFTFLALLIGFPVPLALAVFMAELRRWKWLYSMLAYLPVVVPPVVGILLWTFFYDPSATGVFNSLLAPLGIGPFGWLNSTKMAMPAIVLEATWASAGSTVIIYLAALTGVRPELYEAAELDGAGIWSRIWNVTLPQIRGVMLIMLLLQLIGTMQIFTEPFLFTGGGPQRATQTVLLQIYNYAFINGDYGAAIALSVLLALLLAVVSVVFQLATRKWGDD